MLTAKDKVEEWRNQGECFGQRFGNLHFNLHVNTPTFTYLQFIKSSKHPYYIQNYCFVHFVITSTKLIIFIA